MKTKTFLLMAVAMMLLFTTCKKEQPISDPNNDKELRDDDPLAWGYVYAEYTQPVFSMTNTVINANGNSILYNAVEAQYCSNQPTSDNNVFYLKLNEAADKSKEIRLKIYTPYILPEQFFSTTTTPVPALSFTFTPGVRDDFKDTKADFTWTDVSFNGTEFSGTGVLNIYKTLISNELTTNVYPDQRIIINFNNPDEN